MATDHSFQVVDESSNDNQLLSEGGLSRRPLMRQSSKELPPLVGAPSSVSASRYAENNNVNLLSAASNGSHPSPTQRRKLRYPTNLQVLLNSNKETNFAETCQVATTPSPPVTPRNLSDCSSPGILRRCRQRSSISLDGSPVVRRRSEHHLGISSGRPSTPAGSPRVCRSFSLGGNLNEMSERGAKLLLLGSEGLTQLPDAINREPMNQLSLHHSPEGRTSISDQSGDIPILKTVSHLHAVAEENADDSSPFDPTWHAQDIIDDETGEVLHSKPNTPIEEHYEVTRLGRTVEDDSRKVSHSMGNTTNTRGGLNDLEDYSDEDLPDYQKKPLPTASRIAAWLEGLTDSQLEHSGSVTKSTLPEIGNR